MNEDFPISVERVIELHAAAMQQRGQEVMAPPTAGCVERSIGGAVMGAQYEAIDNEVDPLNVAGRLLFYLCENHCFVDGNKRVAWLACVDLLAMHDVTLAVSTDDAEAFVLAIAQGTSNAAVVIEWLADHVVERVLPS